MASFFYHGLGSALVNNENESIVVFDSLDGTFSAAGILNDGVLVPGRNLFY